MDGQKAGHQKTREIGVGDFLELIADVVKANDLHPAAIVLQGHHQADKIAIAGEENHPVKVAGLEQGVNGQIHVGVGLGGENPFVIDKVLDIFFDDLEPALAQDVVVAVEFLAVLMVILGAGPIFGQIAVGAQESGFAQIGQINEDVVAHAVAAAQADIFGINIDSGLQHRHVTPTRWWPAAWRRCQTPPG